MPAFLFSRKRKSIDYFFQLISAYSEEKCSLLHLWKCHDMDEVFQSFKTLYRYHRNLIIQTDDIIKILTGGIIELDSNFEIQKILPGSEVHQKLELLFKLLDILVNLLHEKNIVKPVLETEKFAFLNSYLFRKGKIIVLFDTS